MATSTITRHRYLCPVCNSTRTLPRLPGGGFHYCGCLGARHTRMVEVAVRATVTRVLRRVLRLEPKGGGE